MSDSTVPTGAVDAAARNGRIRHVGRRQGFSPYPKYKPSGVEWLGEVPEHWDIRRLRHVCRLAYGDSLASRDRDGGGSVLVYGSNGKVGIHSSANVYGPCLIIGRKGSYGKVSYSHLPIFAIDTTYYIDRRHTDADIRWLYYTLTAMQLDSISKDSAIPGLNRQDTYARFCLYPPLYEQCTIAAHLDRETAKIDALIARNEILIEHLKEQRAALISRTVTRGLPPDESRKAGIDPHPKLKPSGVEWLGDVPEHWEVRPIKDATHRPIGGTWGDEASEGDSIVCVRVADFNRDTRIVSENASTLRAVGRNSRQRRLLRPGDLLIEKSGGGKCQPVGVVVIFESGVEAVCSNFIARLSVKKAHIPRYWLYGHMVLYDRALNVPAIKQTTGIQNLDLQWYLATLFCFPPVREQESIATYLDSETAKIDRATNLARQESSLLREYRTSLISDVVTGKVDIRGIGGVESEP